MVSQGFGFGGWPGDGEEAGGRRAGPRVLSLCASASTPAGIAMFIGIGKPVATGSAGPPDTRQQPSVMNEPVTDIIKPKGMSELGIEHANDMAPGTETASFLIDTKLAGQLGHQMPRDKIAKLLQNA